MKFLSFKAVYKILILDGYADVYYTLVSDESIDVCIALEGVYV